MSAKRINSGPYSGWKPHLAGMHQAIKRVVCRECRAQKPPPEWCPCDFPGDVYKQTCRMAIQGRTDAR